MGKIAEKAKFIDMYASLPALSFGKDGKVYSRFGALLTLLTIIIVGGIAIFVGIRIFGRQTPSFIQYQLPPSEYDPTIKFNTDDFKFGIRVVSPADDGVIRGKLTTYDYGFIDSMSGFTKQPFLDANTECKFSITGDKFKCFFQDEESKGKTIIDSMGFAYIYVQYESCWWSNPSGTGCDGADEAATKAIMRNMRTTASIMYEDLMVDPFNFENPIQVLETATTADILLDVPTILEIRLDEVEFTSDNGWIFEDLKTEKRLKPTTTLKLSGDKDQEYLRVELRYGGNKTVYKRTYPKLQDFFAQISGFITIITPIFLILVSPYGNLQAIQHMTNEIYEIKLNKPNPKNDDDSPQKPAAAKKKRRSSKSKINPTTESDLLPQKTIAKSKTRGQSLSTNRTKTFTSPHAALVMGGFGKPPSKELPVPKESTTTFHFDTFDQSPTSELKSLSKIAPDSDNSNLISPQKPFVEHIKLFSAEKQKPEGGKLNENLEDIEAKDLENNDIKAQDLENNDNDDDQNPDDEGVSDCETDVPLRKSDPLEVPWQAWLKSFWKPNPEVQVLKKAQEHLSEAFDLVTLAKKVVEIDKLKACLFTHDQRVIFENLPSSVIEVNPDIDLKSPEAVKRYHWKDSFKGDEIAVRKAYARLRGTKNELDQLLLRLYESEYIDDGTSL